MNVKDTLNYCLLVYPSIFENKWDVYHHWFAVNGNGYDWIDGELVSSDDRKDISLFRAIKKHFEFNFRERKLKNEDDVVYALKSFTRNVNAMLNLSKRETDVVPKREKIYPLCQYAKILNIPPDIKPDWKEAAMEFYDILIANPKITSKKDKELLKLVVR